MMKKIPIYIVISLVALLSLSSATYAAGIGVTVPSAPNVGACLTGLASGNWGTLTSCASGGSGGGTFSTTSPYGTTIVQYPYTTLFTSLDSFATSSSGWWYSPTTKTFNALYGSTTALSATSLCLSSVCVTGWPSGVFSTTSANFWLTLNQGNAFSTTSANYWSGSGTDPQLSLNHYGNQLTLNDTEGGGYDCTFSYQGNNLGLYVNCGGAVGSIWLNPSNTNAVYAGAYATPTTLNDGSGNMNVYNSLTMGGNLTLSALSGTQCLHETAGLVSGTGSDCGSGGSNYFSNSGNLTTLSTGSQLAVPTNGWFSQGTQLLVYASSTNDDTVFGLEAGGGATTNATVYSNTAIGNQSLENDTTGYANTSVGYQALQSNTTGSTNVAVGVTTLNLNTTGTENTGVGDDSLNDNTTGSYNTAYGEGSLLVNSTGSNNTAVGYQAIENDINAIDTTAIGSNAGYGTYNQSSSQDNVFLGSKSGYKNTTGNSNTLLGYWSGYSLTTGSNNIIIGQNVDASSSSALGELDIGNVLFGTGMYNGSSNSGVAVSGKISIATTSSLQTLDVNGNISDEGLLSAACIGTDYTGKLITGTCTGGGGAGTLTNPFMATYYVATSTVATSTFAGNMIVGTTTNPTWIAPAFSVAPSGAILAGTTTSSYLINLGTDPSTTNASTTISVSRLQFYDVETNQCVYWVNSAWSSNGGKCN